MQQMLDELMAQDEDSLLKGMGLLSSKERAKMKRAPEVMATVSEDRDSIMQKEMADSVIKSVMITLEEIVN